MIISAKLGFLLCFLMPLRFRGVVSEGNPRGTDVMRLVRRDIVFFNPGEGVVEEEDVRGKREREESGRREV